MHASNVECFFVVKDDTMLEFKVTKLKLNVLVKVVSMLHTKKGAKYP